MSLRLGFVHVPKCGGTSVSNAIFAAYGMESIHIANLRDQDAAWGPHDVIRHHVSHRLARAAPFLSGHITYSDMKELRRDAIFTVLRDPHAAVLSHFTYHVGRARDPNTLARLPHLERYRDLTLAEYLETAKPGRFLSDTSRDVFSQAEIIDIAASGASKMAANSEARRKIDKALKRFDMVMAGQLSQHMQHLRPYINVDEITIEHRNKSHDTLPITLGAPRQTIIDQLDRLCWLDEYIYARCERLFPETMSPLVPDAEKAMDAFVARFQPSDC